LEGVGRTDFCGQSSQNLLASSWFFFLPVVTKQMPSLLKHFSNGFLLREVLDTATHRKHKKRAQL